MSTTKTFTPLNETGVPIGKCTGMLKNHMQCWRAGDILITTVETVASHDEVINGIETAVPEKEIVDSVQMCRRHAAVEYDAYQKTLPEVKEAPTEPTETKPVEETKTPAAKPVLEVKK